MPQFNEYRIHAQYFDVDIIKARTEDEAIKKFKAKLPKGLKTKVSLTIEQKHRCEGSWHKGCQNMAEFGEGDCRRCQSDREYDRINTPG